MKKEEKLGLKIFLQYGSLIAALGAFNFYNYYRGTGLISLIVALVCVLVLAGWAAYYFLCVRGSNQR
jgi:hypothetical protein